MTSAEKFGYYVLKNTDKKFDVGSVMESTGMNYANSNGSLKRFCDKGAIKRIERGVYVLHDKDKVNELMQIAAASVSNRTSSNKPTNGASRPANQSATMQNQDTIATFNDYVSHLGWLLDEYIPNLEAENASLKEHRNSLYDQLNNFVGIMSKAKVIHARVERDESERMV